MLHPFPQIGIVGGENYTDAAEFDRIFSKIIAVLEPVTVHILDKPGASQLAIRWLASRGGISYKVWHAIPTMGVFAKPLHGLIIVHENGYMEYEDYKKYCLARHLGLIEIS